MLSDDFIDTGFGKLILCIFAYMCAKISGRPVKKKPEGNGLGAALVICSID